MQSGFFSRTNWYLFTMVHAAGRKAIPGDELKSAAMEVRKGNKSVLKSIAVSTLPLKTGRAGPRSAPPIRWAQETNWGHGEGYR